VGGGLELASAVQVSVGTGIEWVRLGWERWVRPEWVRLWDGMAGLRLERGRDRVMRLY
jgi:hypothetical protein